MPGTGRTTQGEGGKDAGSVAPECVKLLLERFPHLQMASLQLLVKNEAFRELCEEYEACTVTARRLAQNGADEALRKEYNALQLRLEGELLGYLSQHRGSTTNE